MFWKRKKRQDEKQKMIDQLSVFLENHDADLVRFEWFYKAFGDIFIEIKINNEVHIFTTDRGDIYYNGRPICNNSYHVAGQRDTFSKLLEMIEKELF